MDALLRRIGRAGVTRGLSGDHWAWLVLAGSAYLLRRSRRPDPAVTSIALEPGETVQISLRLPGADD